MITRAQEALKRHRFALPWLLLGKLLGKFVRVETLVVFCHDLQDRAPPSTSRDPALQIVRIDTPESPSSLALREKYPDKNFHERLQHEGQQCYVAMRDGAVLGYAWVTDSDLYLDEIACTYRVGPGEVFIYDCFVDAMCRGAGIYPTMLDAVVRDNRNRNPELKRACIAASSLNQASIRGILKAGFVQQKRIRYVEYLRKQTWWGLDAVEGEARGAQPVAK